MKKLFFSIVAIMFATSTFAQDFIIKVCEDKIEKKVYYLPNESILVKSTDGKQGFLLSLFFDKKEESVVCTGLSIKSVVGSSCVENSSLFFVMDDDSVLSLSSWNKFNCNAISYFDFDSNQQKTLSTLKIKAIRFKNGKDYASLTGMEAGKETFFIRAFNNLIFKPTNCN